MFSKLMRLVIRTAVYVVIFLGLAWLLLGIPPIDAYNRATYNVKKLFGATSNMASNVSNTAGDMRDAANTQLQRASDRLHGIDPYEKVAEQIGREAHK